MLAKIGCCSELGSGVFFAEFDLKNSTHSYVMLYDLWILLLVMRLLGIRLFVPLDLLKVLIHFEGFPL